MVNAKKKMTFKTDPFNHKFLLCGDKRNSKIKLITKKKNNFQFR